MKKSRNRDGGSDFFMLEILEIIFFFLPLQSNQFLDIMNVTVPMDAVLNFIHSMTLSTSNKRWLAAHLYDEVRAEETAVGHSETDWPKVCREDLDLSPEVLSVVEGVEPLPLNYDFRQERLDYLLKKHQS